LQTEYDSTPIDELYLNQQNYQTNQTSIQDFKIKDAENFTDSNQIIQPRLDTQTGEIRDVDYLKNENLVTCESHTRDETPKVVHQTTPSIYKLKSINTMEIL